MKNKALNKVSVAGDRVVVLGSPVASAGYPVAAEAITALVRVGAVVRPGGKVCL